MLGESRAGTSRGNGRGTDRCTSVHDRTAHCHAAGCYRPIDQHGTDCTVRLACLMSCASCSQSSPAAVSTCDVCILAKALLRWMFARALACLTEMPVSLSWVCIGRCHRTAAIKSLGAAEHPNAPQVCARAGGWEGRAAARWRWGGHSLKAVLSWVNWCRICSTAQHSTAPHSSGYSPTKRTPPAAATNRRVCPDPSGSKRNEP